MIKIFNSSDRDFSSAGNITINPIKCLETRKKSLNGWYLDVEIPIKYKDDIQQDMLCVVKTKSKLNPQAFRIKQIEYSSKKIVFQARHVMFDAEDYFLLDVRPEKKNGQNALSYINERTDKTSPFKVFSNVTTTSTAYFIRRNMLEAWTVIEERWGGVFDADNWNISFYNEMGNDNGETIIYGQNLKYLEVYEDWSSVCTKICPVGYDGITLPENYLESTIQYEEPYTRKIEFETELDTETATEQELIAELRANAEKYLEENQYPKISYEVSANIKEELEMCDKVHVKHPICEILTEVLEYTYNIISKKTKTITFGNYTRDVKAKFDSIKSSFVEIKSKLSKQEQVIISQTNLINSLNKNGYVYIDENEIMILDRLPKSEAKNVWRFGLGGIGFSSNGYEGPFETAITMDGQINAKFITTGLMSVARIEGLETNLNNIYSAIEINGNNITTVIEKVGEQDQKISRVIQTVDEINSKISDIADITTSQETLTGSLNFEKINQSEPIHIEIRATGEQISYLYPFNLLYPADDLYIKLRTLRFSNIKTNEVFDYELPNDLLYYNNENYDSLVLDYDSQTVFINKKCKYNTNTGAVELLDKEVILEYNFPTIDLTDGDYKVQMLKYDNVPYACYLFVRLMTQNIYTTQFATKAEVRSEISQTATSIDLSVTQKLSNYSTTNQMNSAINLKANEITSMVSQTYATKDTTNTLSSRIKQTAKSIELVTTDNKTSAGITIRLRNEDGTQIDSKSANITLSGVVKFTDLSTSGSTTINGSNITTGTINANLIKTGTLSADRLNGGTITGSSINLGNGKFTVTSAGALTATSGKIAGYTISGNQLIGANVGLSGKSGEGYAFWAGSNSAVDAPFRVGHDGSLRATNATISGAITATSGTFQNCTITNSCSVPAGTITGTLSTNNIPNLNASKITTGTLSGVNVNAGQVYGSKVSGMSVSGDTVFVNDSAYGYFGIGSYQGQTFSLIVQHEGQYWRRLRFRGGILVGVDSSW